MATHSLSCVEFLRPINIAGKLYAKADTKDDPTLKLSYNEATGTVFVDRPGKTDALVPLANVAAMLLTTVDGKTPEAPKKDAAKK